MNQTLAAALAYRCLGWRVLPVGIDKRPRFELLENMYGSPGWEGLRSRPASEVEIEEWFRRDPTAGIAVITGSSKGPVVIDVDGALPGNTRLPITPIARSARGVHIYLDGAGGPSHSLPFGDFKAEGGYVVAPPSLHPTGQPYRWLIAPEGMGGLFLPDSPLAGWEETAPLGVGTSGGEIGLESKGVFHLANSAGAHLGSAAVRDLRDWDRIEPFVLAAAALLGIHAPIGQKFRCVLPGHQEQHPSAALWCGDDGVIVYRDFHAAKYTRSGETPRNSFTLAEAYAAKISGVAARLNGYTHRVWKLRLLVATGFIAPAHVAAQPAPPDLSPPARKVYTGFIDLLRVRKLSEPEKPVPFSWRFSAAWCGISQRDAQNGMRELLSRGLLAQEGAIAGPFGKQMAVFALGSLARCSTANERHSSPSHRLAAAVVTDSERSAKRRQRPSRPHHPRLGVSK